MWCGTNTENMKCTKRKDIEEADKNVSISNLLYINTVKPCAAEETRFWRSLFSNKKWLSRLEIVKYLLE